MYTKLASAIINDIYSGLAGLHHNMSISQEQLEDEIVSTRLQVIKEYQLKGILPITDLLVAINCVPVDCKDLERCPTCKKIEDGCGKERTFSTPNAHFEIPQIINGFGTAAIAYIGSIDRQNSFSFYVSSDFSNKFEKYRKRGKRRPYVYIDPVPNENNKYDGYIFNAPLLRTISVVAVFKDLRQLEDYACCEGMEIDQENFNFIDIEVKNRLVQQKVNYYRQLHANNTPNNQQYS